VAHKILYAEDALIELELILDYIRADDPAAAERFGTSLLNHVELLQRFPRIGVPVRERAGIRKLHHTPLRVYYRLHEDRDVIEILHFWHASRMDPPL
jgi:plasmid stabilization system protein ParE